MKYKIIIFLILVFNLLSFSQTNKIKKINIVDKDNNPLVGGYHSIRYMHQLKDNKSEFSEEDRSHFAYDYFISDERENNAVFYEVYKKDKKLNEFFFGYFQEYLRENKDTIYYKIKLDIATDQYYFRTPDPLLFCNQINQKQYFYKKETPYNELRFGRIERKKYNTNVLFSKEVFNKTDAEHLIYKTLVNYTNGKEDNITYYFNVEGLDRVYIPNVKNVKIINNESALPEGFSFHMYMKKGYLSEEVVNSDWFTKQSVNNVDGYIIKEWKNNKFQIKRVKFTPNPTITLSSPGFKICDIDWSFSGMVRSFREGVEWVDNNPMAKEFVSKKVNDLKEWWKSSPSSSYSNGSNINNFNYTIIDKVNINDVKIVNNNYTSTYESRLLGAVSKNVKIQIYDKNAVLINERNNTDANFNTIRQDRFPITVIISYTINDDLKFLKVLLNNNSRIEFH